MAKQTEISPVTFRDATEEDLPFMNEIYNYNIIHTTGLFFTSPVSDEYRLKWFRNLKDPNTDGGPYPCLLGARKDEAGQELKLGYICYLPWLEGAQFYHVAEISLYISQKCTRSGLGAPFLNAILNHPLVERFRVIIAGITTENVPSIKFFSKHGFHFSGEFRNVGFKFGRWLNVAHYTLYFLGVAIPTPSGREISRDNLPHPKTEQGSIVCRDVCEEDLTTLVECGLYPTLNIFDLATAAMKARRVWLQSLSGRPELPCPVIVAHDQDTKSPAGYAYLRPISEKPAYRFSTMLHLVVNNLLAIEGLLDAVLKHQHTKAFRLIIVGITPEETGFKEKLLTRGFRQANVFNQAVNDGGVFKDVLLYELDLKAQAVA